MARPPLHSGWEEADSGARESGIEGAEAIETYPAIVYVVREDCLIEGGPEVEVGR